jgi:hypothetical protein
VPHLRIVEDLPEIADRSSGSPASGEAGDPLVAAPSLETHLDLTHELVRSATRLSFDP